MKKIISLGIASAVCALTAISASAADITFKVNGEVANGQEITIDVTAGTDMAGMAIKVDTTGLEVTKVNIPKADDLAYAKYDKTNKLLMLSNGDKLVASAGDVVCTITAKVTAEAGQKVEVKLSDNDKPDTVIGILPETVVKGAETSSDTSKEESKEESKNEGDNGNKNPGTGVALAVVPAVLAAAGVIVAKKRK